MSVTSIAVFAAGCFWGIEYKFQQIAGVLTTRVGYTGGHVPNPDYKMVCYTNTGHAEAVEVTFNPAIVSFADLLSAFWAMHDPTQVNRQGVDVGTQYRSAIFYTDEEQKKAALYSMAQIQPKFSAPIATEIVAATPFWVAEEYHQCYVQKRRQQGFF